MSLFLLTVFAKNEKDNLSTKEQADHRRLWRQKVSEAYNRIKDALNKALAVAPGHTTGAVVHQIEVPSVIPHNGTRPIAWSSINWTARMTAQTRHGKRR